MLTDFLAPQPNKGTFRQQRALTDQALALAQQNAATQTANRTEARKDVKTGITKGAVPLTEATQVFDPLIGQKQGIYDLYTDSLGVNGAEGYGRAQTGFGNSLTGGDFALDFANENYKRNAASLGQLNSGGTAAGLYELGRGFQNQRVDNWMNRLQGEDPSNMYGNKATALSNLGNFYGNQYNNLANAGIAGAGLQQGAAGMTMGQFNNNAGLLGQQESMRLAAQQQGVANALGIGGMITGTFGKGGAFGAGGAFA
jgi:hypothetical protein